MNFLETLVYRGLEAFGRYYGTYRAVVIKEADEQNRIVLTIPSISKAPILAYPKGQEGSLDSGFKWFSPKPGQIVYVEFIQGELSYPLWTYHGWGKDEIPDELNNNSVAGFKSKRGHYITLDEELGELKICITDPSNQEEESTLISIGSNISIKTNKTLEYDNGNTKFNIEEGKIKVNLEELIFNDGTIGLPKSDSLVTRLNLVESALTNLITALNANNEAIIALVPTWGSVKLWCSSTVLTNTKVSDIANDKIKQ